MFEKINICEPSWYVITDLNGTSILKAIEDAGRTCYQSYKVSSEDSYLRFVKMVIARGHESVLEHQSLTVKFSVDRAVQNELVRHRLSSFSVESSRYCNYGLDKFGSKISVIRPITIKYDTEEFIVWAKSMESCAESYFELLKTLKPEDARSVLPLSLRTEVTMTANLREWRHIFKLRCDKAAHPSMRQVMIPLLNYLKSKIPVVFDDLEFQDISDTL